MGDADKSLKVGIDIQTNTEGAPKAEKAIRGVKDEVNGSVGALNNLSDETRKYIKHLQDHGEAAEKTGVGEHKLKELFREMTAASPEVANAVGEITEPMLGLAFAIGAMVAKAIEYQRQYQEMITRAGPDWEADAKRIEDVRQSYEDATEKLAAFNREVERAASEPRTPQQQMDTHLEAVKQAATIEGQLLQKRQQIEEAAVDASVKMGVATAEEGERAKLAIYEKYAQLKLKLDAQTRAQELAALQQERAAYDYQEHVARGELNGPEGAAAAASSATAAKKSNADKLENNQANLQKALEERKKLQEDIADLQLQTQHHDSATVGIWVAKHLGFSAQSPEDAKKTLEDRYAANEGVIGLLQGQVGKEKAAAPGLEDASAQADEKLQEIQGKLKAAVEKMAELDAQITAKQALNRMQDEGAQETFHADDAAKVITQLPNMAAGHTEQTQQLSQHLTNFMQTINGNTTKLISAVATNAATQQMHTQAIEKLLRDAEMNRSNGAHTFRNMGAGY